MIDPSLLIGQSLRKVPELVPLVRLDVAALALIRRERADGIPLSIGWPRVNRAMTLSMAPAKHSV